MLKPEAATNHPTAEGRGTVMFQLAERLFPICRSLTGEGVRETLRILQEHIPLQVHEVPSGTQAFDWNVPPEWNITDAWVKDEDGHRVIDFQKSNLHLVGYSEPFEGRLSLDELDSHLHSLPDEPDLIPYVTSYYSRYWGFCLPHHERLRLKEGMYDVKIESTLQDGSLTYADLLIPGASKKEILISTYICHPSMANNELSGPIVATFLARQLLEKPDLRYSYRFVFIPETIGSIVYLSRHLEELKKNVIGGYVITCAGDPGQFSYLLTPGANALVDQITLHVLAHSEPAFKTYDYLERGSDERQYCSPGVDLPIGSLMRTKYTEYSQYHTSGDDLSFISGEALAGTLDKYELCLSVFEQNAVYKTTVPCEPQLGKRGLYPTLSTKDSGLQVRTMLNLLAFCDGRRDLIEIAERIKVPVWELFPIVAKMSESGLLEQVETDN